MENPQTPGEKQEGKTVTEKVPCPLWIMLTSLYGQGFEGQENEEEDADADAEGDGRSPRRVLAEMDTLFWKSNFSTGFGPNPGIE